MTKETTLDSIIDKNIQPISTQTMMYGVLATAMVSIPTVLLINKYAYDDKGNLVCDDYVLNSYLYTALGFCYIALGVILEQKVQLLPKVMMRGLIVAIAFFFGYITVMYLLFKQIRNTDPNNTVQINLYYALACILFGIILSITIMIGIGVGVLYPAIAITIGLTILMGYIGYKYGASFITVDFDKYLKYALFGLIVWTFILPFFVRDTKNLLLLISIPSAIIFCLLLMSYNNKLRKNSEKCKVPNYPDEAIGLVIKIGNLLADVIRILTALKGKRGKGGRLLFKK
jgi:hypothetical protein